MELAQDPDQWWSHLFEILSIAANDIQFFHIWIFMPFFSHFPSYMTSVYCTILNKSRRAYLLWRSTLNCYRNTGHYRLILATIHSQSHQSSIPGVQLPKTQLNFIPSSPSSKWKYFKTLLTQILCAFFVSHNCHIHFIFISIWYEMQAVNHGFRLCVGLHRELITCVILLSSKPLSGPFS
jgi:hypothetical protein